MVESGLVLPISSTHLYLQLECYSSGLDCPPPWWGSLTQILTSRGAGGNFWLDKPVWPRDGMSPHVYCLNLVPSDRNHSFNVYKGTMFYKGIQIQKTLLIKQTNWTFLKKHTKQQVKGRPKKRFNLVQSPKLLNPHHRCGTQKVSLGQENWICPKYSTTKKWSNMLQKPWFIKVWDHNTTPIHIWDFVPNKSIFLAASLNQSS